MYTKQTFVKLVSMAGIARRHGNEHRMARWAVHVARVVLGEGGRSAGRQAVEHADEKIKFTT